jgi:CRP/FNR family transcriptional regulator
MAGPGAIPFRCESFVALPQGLPFAASQKLEGVQRTQCYPSHSTLFHQGEQLAGVFLLKRGSVKLSMTSKKGRAVILRLVRAGEILGLSSVLSEEPSMTTAQAFEDSEVAYVEREPFLRLLADSPEAALSVARHAYENYRAACQQVRLLALCRSASERLAQFLLNWASSRAHRTATSVALPLTHEEISQAAGTSRETVTRTLIDFRKKGWASVAASHLRVEDREALEEL